MQICPPVGVCLCWHGYSELHQDFHITEQLRLFVSFWVDISMFFICVRLDFLWYQIVPQVYDPQGVILGRNYQLFVIYFKIWVHCSEFVVNCENEKFLYVQRRILKLLYVQRRYKTISEENTFIISNEIAPKEKCLPNIFSFQIILFYS